MPSSVKLNRSGNTMLSETEFEKIRTLVSKKGKVAYAVLFGSALHRLSAHSDIDLLIGGRLAASEKADLFMELAVELGRQIDILSPEETRCEVVLRALSSGVPILVRDRGRMREDYFRHFRFCDQGTPLRKIRLERLKRVYGNG